MIKKSGIMFCFFCLIFLKYSQGVSSPIIFSPSVNPPSVYVGIPTPVTITCKINDPNLIKPSVNLLLLDKSEKPISILGSLNDEGLSGDLVPGDNIYTIKMIFSPEQVGSIKLKISAAFKGLLRRILSETFEIYVNNNTSPDISQDIMVGPLDLANIVIDQYQRNLVINQVLIAFKPEATIEDIRNAISTVNGSIIGQILELNIYEIQLPTKTLEELETALEILRANPLIESATKNILLKTSDIYDIDDLYLSENKSWPFWKIDAPKAWSYIRENNLALKPISIAVLDTGIKRDHPEFKGVLLESKSFVTRIWREFIVTESMEDIDDENGHGTSVAGIIGAVNNELRDGVSMNGVISGVLNNYKLLSIKVCSKDYCGGCKPMEIIAGIYDVVKNSPFTGVRIINMSLGGELEENEKKIFEIAISHAVKKNILVVAAAGNENRNSSNIYPCAIPGVICVGAVDKEDKASRWGDSTVRICGKMVDPATNFGYRIDLYAPGGSKVDGIYTTDRNRYTEFFKGTSAATPFVSGAAALVWSLHPDWTASQVRDALVQTADATGKFDPEGNEIMRLNVYKALKFTTQDPWLSFIEGKPNIPGDGLVIMGGSYQLSDPFPLKNLNDGFTLTLFVPPPSTINPFPFIDIELYLYLKSSNNSLCSLLYPPEFIPEVSPWVFRDFKRVFFNGIEGFYKNISPFEIQNMVDWINRNPNCNVVADDLLIDKIILLYLFTIPQGYPDPSPPYFSPLDAAAILPGQNAVPPGSNIIPVAKISMAAEGKIAYENQTLNLMISQGQTANISFSASRSSDIDGSIASYKWYINGTPVSTDRDFNFSLGIGTHQIYLEIWDNLGAQGGASATIVIIKSPIWSEI